MSFLFLLQRHYLNQSRKLAVGRLEEIIVLVANERGDTSSTHNCRQHVASPDHRINHFIDH